MAAIRRLPSVPPVDVQLRLTLVVGGHESTTWVSMSGPLFEEGLVRDWGHEAAMMGNDMFNSFTAHGTEELLKRELSKLTNTEG